MSESMVERRLRYIERQKALGHGVNVQFEGMKPQGQGPVNRHGLPSVPVDQRVVENWPVLDLGDIPDVSLAEWRLEVAGLVENPVTLTWDDFLNLPQADDVSDFHCVTSWSRLGNHWRGVQFKTIAELAVPHSGSPIADRVTASIGVCTVSPAGGGDPRSLYREVDKLLYAAKQGGRNQVIARNL